mmetsp:Transcript_121/g.259  ORF Transcript_121/g.259 Transcript_121/m.259 type:complete len:673 (-) Transcript_121:64-2082(-)|eukprot:CAMPEP_0197655376 /NCGR_PEP_ID=MMETSP1338-20131121/39414_1 /TAXON_ID=43686 ORGANISM="Pelagodinium beii, Strain RCC1491" /NCGR_SAMPLE_ID=MMETSP1338 /ASSEMBLY_ACC=CAM_ASM_000754 /LENGTH=672 /DNA_ID=CAMNT_0043231011 /DNA_START=18 /DNA_END=2036 /DNA_ORIENTATION=-
MMSEWKQVSASGGNLVAGRVAVPPLSSVLDPKIPAVEFEADRLHAALTWLYSAVQTLQTQSGALKADLGRVEGTLLQWTSAASAEAEKEKEGSRAGSKESTEEIRQLVKQHEQRRLGDQKMVEMRLDSLSSAVEHRLKPSDLEEFRSYLTKRLEEIESSSKEELSKLASAVHGESATDRRQLQMQFEVLRRKVEAQLEILSTPSGGDEQRLKAAVASAEAAAAEAQAAAAGLEGIPGSGGQDDASGPSVGGFEKRLRALERLANASASATLDLGAASGSENSESAPGRPLSRPGVAGDLQARLDRLEATVASFRTGLGRSSTNADGSPALGTGIGGDSEMPEQFLELQKAHSETHQRCLEVHSRLENLEQGMGLGAPNADGKPQVVAAWQEPLDSVRKQNEALDEVLKDQAADSQQLTKAVDAISRYISGESLAIGEDSSESKADALAWLEHRVRSFTKKRESKTLEGKLASMEAQHLGSEEKMGERVHKVEGILDRLDVDEMREVPPQLVMLKLDAESFKKDLRREVAEMKALVGCIEACVPKETRKAIQLFKQAAGAVNEIVVTPRGLKLEGDILGLREDMETRLKAAEQVVEEQCQRVTMAVKNIERKQESLSYELDGNRRVPEPFPTSPSTRLEASPSRLDALTPKSVAATSPSGLAAPKGWSQNHLE